jgi:hypothetical protein
LTNRPRERHWVVDSIEEHVASIELDDGKMITIPQSQLPATVKQGDVLRVTIEVDAAATKAAYDRSAAQLRPRKATGDPRGDIKL